VKMTPVWNCNTSETTKSLHASTIDFNVTMKMKVLKMQLLNKLQQNTKRRQKTRKVMRMTHLSLRLIGSKAHCNRYRFSKTLFEKLGYCPCVHYFVANISGRQMKATDF